LVEFHTSVRTITQWITTDDSASLLYCAAFAVAQMSL